MKVIIAAGARPNFIKIAPLISGMSACNRSKPGTKVFEFLLVHTGQHYDKEMSALFFKELEIPSPDIHLGVGSGTHAEQTGKIMISFEKILLQEKPDLVIVVGDVNSTLACSLTAAKLLIPVAHVESGLRSFDRSMPEEINRIITDALSDFLFTSCESANRNLRNEGIQENKIYFVGNVMIDVLFQLREAAARKIRKFEGLSSRSYALLTLHRPSNVDQKDILLALLDAFREISRKIPVIFPAHPRTLKRIEDFGFSDRLNKVDAIRSQPEPGLYLTPPLSYLDFLYLMDNAGFVMTDSGGIQEETSILDVPCLTLRANTERPVTIEKGTNILVGSDPARIIQESLRILNGSVKKAEPIELWDGKTAKRIVDVLKKDFKNK